MARSQDLKTANALASLLDPKVVALIVALLGGSNVGQMLWQDSAKAKVAHDKVIFEVLATTFATQLATVHLDLQLCKSEGGESVRSDH